MKDPHAILGVPWNADPRHIRAAYKKRAAELHPDRNPAPDAADKLKDVIEAYRFLNQPGRQWRDSANAPQRRATGTAAESSAQPAFTTAELRRHFLFRYHFEKLLRSDHRSLIPWRRIRQIAASMLGGALLVMLITKPDLIQFQNPETHADEFMLGSAWLVAMICILLPQLPAQIPAWNPRRGGLDPTLPEWLVEACGWIMLLPVPLFAALTWLP